MKKVSTLFVMLLVAMLTSCSEDDSPQQLVNKKAENIQEAADGEWHLVQVSGSIAGVSHLFEPGTITWTFNDDGTVTVENTNTDEGVEDFLESGVYESAYIDNDQMPSECDELLIVNNINFGCEQYLDDNLSLTQQVADGYQLKFVKM